LPSRIVWLIAALLLALPPLLAGWTALCTTAFLVEFFSGGRWRPLSAVTSAPVRRPLPASAGGRIVPVDVYVSPSLHGPTGLVLVHGITDRGKDDPQVRGAAMLLARAGWAVAVPTVAGLTVLRLRPDDSLAVAAAARALADQGYRPVAILGVSLGAAPALAAAAEPDIAPRLSAVMMLGGYASARELLRYTLTGAYAFGDIKGRRPVDEDGIARFAGANAELVAGSGRALVDNRDPAAIDGLIAALPGSTQRLLDALSPSTFAARSAVPLFLLHGREDRTVPFTESLRLSEAARASGRPVRTAIVGAVSHVDPEDRATPRELIMGGAEFYAFRIAAESAGLR
jgi:dienelactone hydrolase